MNYSRRRMISIKNLLSLVLVLVIQSSIGYTQMTPPEIKISQPVENQIVQRNINGNATIYITGYHDVKLSVIEGRLISETNPNNATPWTPLAIEATEGVFSGSLAGYSGWHKLEIRATLPDGSSVITQVNRVGVGEVFVVGGASNSMGMSNHGSKTASSNVISFNQVNKKLDNNGVTVVPDQPYDFPFFSRYEAENAAYPTGESAWCWGELGDKIYQKTGCPVLFFNVGWAAANSADYRTNAEGNDAYNFFIEHYWPFRQPYTNVVNTLKYFTSWLGVRSILWAHGETDAEYTNHTQRQYVNNITYVINESRAAAGQNVNWAIAVGGASLGSSTPTHPITHAQVELGTKPGLNTWLGPNTDTIQVPRHEGHFANLQGGIQGLSLAAEAWNRNLTSEFFAHVIPISPRGTIHTGTIPSRTFPGASFPVSYQPSNMGAGQANYQAELMTENGKYTAVIGFGNSNPLWVTIPAGISNGDYRIRITAVQPFVQPGSISEVITVDSTAIETQLIRNFKVIAVDNHSQIQWLHTAYPDLQKLTLQKSKNSFEYYDIVSFDATNNRNTSRLYDFKDQEENNGILFYRIKSETGEQIIYSQAVPLFTGPQPPSFTIFPNPVQNYCMVLTDTDEHLSFQVFDSNGSEIDVITNSTGIAGMTTIQMNPAVVSGIYYLIIKGKDISEVRKILIQR